MAKVVILGAGSSKECDFPLGNEVWPYLDYNNGQLWNRFLSHIFPQFCCGIDKYPTFELVLTLIESHIRSGQKLGQYPSSELNEIKKSLVNSYVKVFDSQCLEAEWRSSAPEQNGRWVYDANDTYDNFEGWYKPFFNNIVKESKNKSIVFISLNYDVLIDIVLNDLVENEEIQDFNYGFDIYNLHSQNEKHRTGGILLLKPHGSINLAQCRKCKKIFFSGSSPQGINSIKNSYKCNSCNQDLDVLILPPMFNKANENESYAIIHKKISEVITNASEILIVGYSLPDYDLNILEAFLRGSIKHQNRSKLKIEIVDQSNDKDAYTKSKYNNIFHRIQKENYYIDGFKKYACQKIGFST